MNRGNVRRLRSAALKVLIPLLTQTIGRLPYPALRLCGKSIGWLLLTTNRRYRERSREHLTIAFPDANDETVATLQRGCFDNAAMNAIETLQLLARGSGPIERRLTVEGWQHVAAETEAGRRVLLLTAHCGFWELLGVAVARQGSKLFAFGRKLDEPVFSDLVAQVRQAVATETIERGTPASRRLLRQALTGDGALTILIDQDTKVDGTWVPFFGRPAHTPLGAAELAIRREMRVIPAFLERHPGGRHTARFLPALDLPDDATAATAVMSTKIEEQIRRLPEQWVWWHRRWRRQPEDGELAAGSQADVGRDKKTKDKKLKDFR